MAMHASISDGKNHSLVESYRIIKLEE